MIGVRDEELGARRDGATTLKRWLIALACVAVWTTVAGAQDLVATPYSKSGVYKLKETVGWTIAVAPEQQAAPGEYTYIVQRDGAVEIKKGSFDLTKGPTKIEASLAVPGMIRVAIRPPAGAQHFGNVHTGGTGVVVLGAAVDPTNIKPAVARPSDFDAFWASKLDGLKRVKFNPTITSKPSTDSTINYATFRLDNVGGAHVYGQMAWPKREGKFPALAIFQWASAPYPLEPGWVIDRAKEGWFAINVEPHDVPSDMPAAFYAALPQMIKNYNTINDTDRDHNYFLQMYLGDYQALEYLSTRPEWDGRTLVVTGTSMGGQQSLVMAGLHPKVTGVVVNVPAGSDANAALHDRMAGYPNWNSKNPVVMETARYFDVTNFAPNIRAPSMLAFGFIDEVVPPIGVWSTFNLIRAPKEAVPMIDSPHNHQATPQQLKSWTTRSEIWLAALRRGETPPIQSNW